MMHEGDNVSEALEYSAERILELRNMKENMEKKVHDIEGKVIKIMGIVDNIKQLYGKRWDDPEEIVELTTSGRVLLKVKELEKLL